MRRRLLALCLLILAAACGGDADPVAGPVPSDGTTTSLAGPTTTNSGQTTDGTTTEAAPPISPTLPGIPDELAGYRQWARLNREPIPPRDADPHLGTKNVYASKVRRTDGRFPYGTIVVKDASRPGKDFIGLIAVMRKERGADPAHNDWLFVEYTRDHRGDRFREIGSGMVCWSCHVGAVESDYVFTE